MGKHGTNQHTIGFDKNKIIKLSQGGTSSIYRLGRLKRDHPSIAKRYASGEFKSVSAAEVAAGIRAVAVRDRSLMSTVQARWSEASPSERADLKRWINQQD